MKEFDNTLLSKMNMVVSDLCKEIAAKQDGMILGRLEEMGYDVTDKEAIAKRCELRVFEDNEVKEIWIDSNTPDQRLVCYFTETKIIEDTTTAHKITTEFKFAPMPE